MYVFCGCESYFVEAIIFYSLNGFVHIVQMTSQSNFYIPVSVDLTEMLMDDTKKNNNNNKNKLWACTENVYRIKEHIIIWNVVKLLTRKHFVSLIIEIVCWNNGEKMDMFFKNGDPLSNIFDHINRFKCLWNIDQFFIGIEWCWFVYSMHLFAWKFNVDLLNFDSWERIMWKLHSTPAYIYVFK